MTLGPSDARKWAGCKLDQAGIRRPPSSSGPRSSRWKARTPWLVGEALVQAKWALLGIPLFPVQSRYELLARAVDQARARGLWLEFGVWNGDSINYIASRAGQPVFGFDSFEGLPENWSPRLPAGSFSTRGAMPKVGPTVQLLPGWFDQTLPRFLEAHPTDAVAFLHLDCDLCSSTRTVLNGLDRRIREGTVVVFDEFCGALPDDEARAWREFCHRRAIRYRWIGSSVTDSVALEVISTGA